MSHKRSPSAPFRLAVDWLFLLVVFVVLGLCLKCWGATREAQVAAKATCKVISPVGDGDNCGSGILIADGNGDGVCFVLTAAHVVEQNRNKITCEWWNGETATGRATGYNRAIDVAAIQLETPPAGIVGARLRCEPVQPGDRLLFLGYARGQDLTIRDAVMRGYWGGAGVASLPSIPGMSGGPVIDMEGKVVGPLWATMGETIETSTETAFATVAQRTQVLIDPY